MSSRRAGATQGTAQLSLFSDAVEERAPVIDLVSPPADRDGASRAYAVDPANNVVLEASAGTGKTTVLVTRYVNLLKAGVKPANILAMTFTRKAAAEMRERIVTELREAAERSEIERALWGELRDRVGEIAIGTIDAFCLSLLKEFPLEADLEPGFDLADETEVPRLVDEALDRALRIFAGLARSEPDIALVLAQLGMARTREGLAALLERRLVAWDALHRFLARGPADLTAAGVCRRAAESLHAVLRNAPGGLPSFLEDGPWGHPRFVLFAREIERLAGLPGAPDAAIRASIERIGAHFLTEKGRARRPGTAIAPYKPEHYRSKEASKRHRETLFQLAPQIESVVFGFNRDLNVVLARGVRRMFGIALEQYRAALAERSVLDFSDVLQRALALLRQMDEFSQSRFRLESRYHHVLVDEFQDTSRAQWELIALLVRAWGEGAGLAARPSIFIVGDRKQSIYRFRDAEVAVLTQAGLFIDALRPGGSARRSITRSFRAVPELLAFVNEVFTEMSAPPSRPDEFSYTEDDRFPVADQAPHGAAAPVLGLQVAETPDASAAAVAREIERILREETVRDKQTGLARQARPGDIAILFRSRASHREFERELAARSIPSYVYKGLGFFDADEVKDLTALMRYLAMPTSDLRAAAFLRSRVVGLSDDGLAMLAPRVAAAIATGTPPPPGLDDEDRRVLEHTRTSVAAWLAAVDRIPPADLIDGILADTAYAFELRGARRPQAWENVKKVRGLVRRIQNRGYATLARIADYIDALSAGDESNAVIEALDAVNLMTVHAAKGLEFPIVFVVNLAKGATGPPKPIRVIVDGEEDSVSVGPFVSEMEEADRARELHETRRLLYVALTRARDRLYLSTLLKEGALVPGRGSLAEVLPDSLKRLFERAAASFDGFERAAWTSASGRLFEWRVCGSQADMDGGTAPITARADDGRSWTAPSFDGRGGRVRRPVTASLASNGDAEAHDASPVEPIVGALVHRLFQYSSPVQPLSTVEEAAALALRLLSADERATVTDPDAVARAAATAWLGMRGRADVVRALEGARTFEVPFTLAAPGGVLLRGTIDCLVERADGSITVVEFKTGRPRRSHHEQLDIYVAAARALFPDVPIDGVLLYP